MRQENHQDLSRYADDLAFAFPNILGLARGLSDTDSSELMSLRFTRLYSVS